MLHESPELVHRFYQDVSKLGRPEQDGIMGITTTMLVSSLSMHLLPSIRPGYPLLCAYSFIPVFISVIGLYNISFGI